MTWKTAALAFALGSVLAAPAAQATSFSPTSEFFKKLPGATFGGNGIPNDPAAFSTFVGLGGDILTLGLIATQRYSSPELGNDGNGTYTAGPGSSFGGDPVREGSLWNISFFAGIERVNGNSVLSDYDLTFYYDFDPGTNTPTNELGMGSTNGALAAFDAANSTDLFNELFSVQGSENMLFSYLAFDVQGVQKAPEFGSFDQNALGEYTFAFQVGANAAANVATGADHVAIKVNVVPVPVALPMLLSAFGVAALIRRRARAA